MEGFKTLVFMFDVLFLIALCAVFAIYGAGKKIERKDRE